MCKIQHVNCKAMSSERITKIGREEFWKCRVTDQQPCSSWGVWSHKGRRFSCDLGSWREDWQVPVGQMLSDPQPTVEGTHGDKHDDTEAPSAIAHAALQSGHSGTARTGRTFTCSCTCRSAPWSALCRSSPLPSASLSPAGSVPTWKPTTHTVETILQTDTQNNSTKLVLKTLK